MTDQAATAPMPCPLPEEPPRELWAAMADSIVNKGWLNVHHDQVTAAVYAAIVKWLNTRAPSSAAPGAQEAMPDFAVIQEWADSFPVSTEWPWRVAMAKFGEHLLHRAPSSGWRFDMENAPKDGTPVLLWLKKSIDRNYTVSGLCDLLVIGFWQHKRWCSIEVEDCGSMGGELTGWMPDWCPLEVKPAAWRPLPAPPPAAETRGT